MSVADELYESGEDRATIGRQLAIESQLRAAPGPIGAMTMRCGLCGRVDFLSNITSGRCCRKDDLSESPGLD